MLQHFPWFKPISITYNTFILVFLQSITSKIISNTSIKSPNPSLYIYCASTHGVEEGTLSTPLGKESKHQDHAQFTTQLLLLFMAYKATVVKVSIVKYCPALQSQQHKNVETPSS